MSIEYSIQLTGEQKALHSGLFNAIYYNHGVADILSNQSEEDIRAVLTTLYWKSNDIHRTLPALVALLDHTKALEDILNAASKIQGLEKEILTNTQYEYKRNESEITRYTLPEYIYNRKSNMIATIEERMKTHGIPIPQKQQDKAAGPNPVISSPESPSFLSQHKGEILAAVAGLVCSIVGVVLLYAGNPLGGIALLAGASLLLATTKEGQEMYKKVGKTLYYALPGRLKSTEPARG